MLTVASQTRTVWTLQARRDEWEGIARKLTVSGWEAAQVIRASLVETRGSVVRITVTPDIGRIILGERA